MNEGPQPKMQTDPECPWAAPFDLLHIPPPRTKTTDITASPCYDIIKTSFTCILLRAARVCLCMCVRFERLAYASQHNHPTDRQPSANFTIRSFLS